MAMTVDQLSIALGRLATDMQKPSYKRSMGKSATIIRKDHKVSLRAGKGPDGSPIRKVVPLPKFKKGEVLFVGRHPQTGRKMVVPIKLRSARMASRATKLWNQRYRRSGNAPGRTVKWKKRGGSPYSALVKSGKPRRNTLFAMMTKKRRRGHVEVVTEKSLLIGPKGGIVSIHAFGTKKMPGRDFYGLSKLATARILDTFSQELLDKVLKRFSIRAL